MNTQTIQSLGIKLIGIAGNAGVGKDTAGEYIADSYDKIDTNIFDANVKQYAFAEALKEICANVFYIPLTSFYDPEAKETLIPELGTTPRKIAQFVGTEMFRNLLPQLCPDLKQSIWIRNVEKQILHQRPRYAIITDVRFQDEAEWIVSNGGIILHLTRPEHTGKVGIENHASESQISWEKIIQGGNEDALKQRWIIENNGTIQDLYKELDEFLNYVDRFYSNRTQIGLIL